MLVQNGTFQLSASDLTRYLSCRHHAELDRSVAEGRLHAPEYYDPALAFLQERGLEHEKAYVRLFHWQSRISRRSLSTAGMGRSLIRIVTVQTHIHLMTGNIRRSLYDYTQNRKRKPRNQFQARYRRKLDQ